LAVSHRERAAKSTATAESASFSSDFAQGPREAREGSATFAAANQPNSRAELG